MKKLTLAAMVIGSFAASAHAQSNVTVYGLVDAGIVSERGGKAGNVTKLTSGVGAQSRLGFRGTEDLGNGLSALFVLETGVKIDDGTLDNTASALFNRQALVGLKSKDLGGLTLGRQYTPWYNTLGQVADPFGGGYAGSAKNLFPAGGSHTRTSNTILYATPSLSGFSAEVSYSLGEQAGDNTAGRQIGAVLAYSNGQLNVRAAYTSLNSDVAAAGTTPKVSHDNGNNFLIAANYNFTVVKAFLAYGKDKGFNSAPLPNATAFPTPAAPSIDSNDLLLGVTAPIGSAGTLMASYIRKDDKTFNQDADQWAVGYSHALSNRTSAYLAYAKIKNKNGASYTVGNNNEVGSGDKAFNLGVKHAF